MEDFAAFFHRRRKDPGENDRSDTSVVTENDGTQKTRRKSDRDSNNTEDDNESDKCADECESDGDESDDETDSEEEDWLFASDGSEWSSNESDDSDWPEFDEDVESDSDEEFYWQFRKGSYGKADGDVSRITRNTEQSESDEESDGWSIAQNKRSEENNREAEKSPGDESNAQKEGKASDGWLCKVLFSCCVLLCHGTECKEKMDHLESLFEELANENSKNNSGTETKDEGRRSRNRNGTVQGVTKHSKTGNQNRATKTWKKSVTFDREVYSNYGLLISRYLEGKEHEEEKKALKKDYRWAHDYAESSWNALSADDKADKCKEEHMERIREIQADLNHADEVEVEAWSRQIAMERDRMETICERIAPHRQRLQPQQKRKKKRYITSSFSYCHAPIRVWKERKRRKRKAKTTTEPKNKEQRKPVRRQVQQRPTQKGRSRIATAGMVPAMAKPQRRCCMKRRTRRNSAKQGKCPAKPREKRNRARNKGKKPTKPHTENGPRIRIDLVGTGRKPKFRTTGAVGVF